MKTIGQQLIGWLLLLAIASCSGMVDKAKEKAGEILAEQIEKATSEAAEAQAGEGQAEQPAAETQQQDTRKEEIAQAPDWWQKDFRLVFDWTPAGFGGTSTGMTKHVVIQRRGDAFRLTQEMSGQKTDFIFKVEDGQMIQYLINTDTKKAGRLVAQNQSSTIDQRIKGQLSEHGFFPKTDPAKSKDAKRDGSETFAGRKCEKWVTEKNTFGSISRATVLLDAECRVNLKSDFYFKLSGTESSGNLLTVHEFTFSPNPGEVVTDFSGYEMVD